jgi:hypothetical protein
MDGSGPTLKSEAAEEAGVSANINDDGPWLEKRGKPVFVPVHDSSMDGGVVSPGPELRGHQLVVL